MSALELYQVALNPAWCPTLRRDEIRLDNGTALALHVPGQGWAYVLSVCHVIYVSNPAFSTNRAALLGAIAQLKTCTFNLSASGQLEEIEHEHNRT